MIQIVKDTDFYKHENIITQETDMERLVVTPQEAAEMLATSPNNIYTLLESGEIPAYKQGSYWKVPVRSLEQFVITMANAEAEGRRKKCQE